MRKRQIVYGLLAYVLGVLLFLAACVVYDLWRRPVPPPPVELKHP